MRSVRLREAPPSFDKRLVVPNLVYAYCLIISPMLEFAFPPKDITAPQVGNQIFWPAVAALALGCLASRSRERLIWPPNMVWFAAYLALAGASVLWAFKPEVSFTRFATETMMLIAVILPSMLAVQTADMMRGVFFCFLIGAILNAVLILGGYSDEMMAGTGDAGFPGYFTHKNALGQFAAFAIILSLYEIIQPGWRRALGLITIVTGIYLIFAAHSKAALGCVVLAAVVAKLVLVIGKKMRVSPAIVLLALPVCYAVLSETVGNLVNRISWYLYHNYNLSARTDIWNFVDIEVAKRPLLGWGYRSFWLVGPDSPNIVDSGGWMTHMPEAHNGYLDTIVDTGYIGLVLFLIFVVTTLHAIGRVADRDPTRAWFLLTVALFIILVNFLESGWMRGADALWLMFVVVATEAGRWWQPLHPGSVTARPVLRAPAIALRRPVLAKAGGADRLPRPRGQLQLGGEQSGILT
jgi:exopolysaccharide production protein ExoQ